MSLAKNEEFVRKHLREVDANVFEFIVNDERRIDIVCKGIVACQTSLNPYIVHVYLWLLNDACEGIDCEDCDTRNPSLKTILQSLHTIDVGSDAHLLLDLSAELPRIRKSVVTIAKELFVRTCSEKRKCMMRAAILQQFALADPSQPCVACNQVKYAAILHDDMDIAAEKRCCGCDILVLLPCCERVLHMYCLVPDGFHVPTVCEFCAKELTFLSFRVDASIN